MTVDPARPQSFPRRILVSVLGLSPQVVTETIWALAIREDPPFVPTELVIVTTSEGAERVHLLLCGGKRMLDALAADYPGRGLEGLAERTTVHVVSDATGAPLSDISSLEANTALADLLVDVVRKLTADPASAIHLSIAGGRKTMGFLAGYALSLLGRPQDRLSHVLVDPAFEQLSDFFYPPPEPRVVFSRTPDQKPLSTDRCGLVLAEIPFVRLREGLPRALLEGRASFRETVESLQERFRPPELAIDLERREVRLHGRTIDCPPVELAFWAWMAERRVELGDAAWVEKRNPDGLRRFEELYGTVRERRPARTASEDEERKPYEDDPKGEWLGERVSRLNKLVEAALGPAAVYYRVERSGGRSATVYRLATPPEAIRLSWKAGK
ncbi:MAG: CRISPR-associated ring nuclease Csm6 [Geminicoccaceae bacterium]|nr:CRISPR-associated ring nuclease Csm6 [Geminicoccaceae bacterium]